MEQFRKDFKMLEQDYIYFNSASTAYKPKVVLDELTAFYDNYSVNTNRGVDSLGYKVTTKFEKVRTEIAEFLNAEINEIVFTRGTTESINLVANGFQNS